MVMGKAKSVDSDRSFQPHSIYAALELDSLGPRFSFLSFPSPTLVLRQSFHTAQRLEIKICNYLFS